MCVEVSVVQIVLAVAPGIDAKIGIGAKDAQRSKRKVQREHVVRERKLV